MQKRRPSRPCPIPGCWNKTWASRGLDVCGECANSIATIMRTPAEKRPGQMEWEAAELRSIIRRQTQELLELKGSTEPRTTKPERPTEGVVYYLRSGGYIKIGWTSDLAKRMRAYSPDSVLLAVHPGTRKDEHRLHKRFATDRTHGREWFAMTPSVMHHIEQMAAEHGTPDPVAFAAQPVAIPQPRDARPIMPRGWNGRAVVGT